MENYPIKSTVRFFGLWATLMCVAGCSDGLGYIRGSVKLDGETVVRDDSTICEVVFAPTTKDGAVVTGSVDSSGVFQASAGTTRGMPPGKYRVGVMVRHVEPPEKPGGYPKFTMLSKRQQATPKESGILVEVVPGSNWFDLEVTR